MRSASGDNKHRILVVEDNDQLRAVLVELLTAQGYHVIQARNGTEAMMALSAPDDPSPDLVVLDINLPLESGVSVLTFLRTVLNSRMPVVVLTGRADPDQEAAIADLGVSAYIRKPAPADQLLEAVRRALPTP